MFTVGLCSLVMVWFDCFVEGHLKDLGEVLPHDHNTTSQPQRLEIRVVGGKPATLAEFPYAVQFFNHGGMCSGTILSEKIVLTAAHCFQLNKNVAEMSIFSRARYAFDPKASTHEVWEFKVHDHYNAKGQFENDVALILIHDKFKYGPKVKKAYLVNTDEWLSDENADFTVSGWGMTKYANHSNSADVMGHRLLKTKLNIIEKQKCEDVNNTTIGPDMFCLFGDGIRDTCQGDSGGSVLWKGTVVGVVSHGYRCAVRPSMYVNVYHFRTWIQKTTRTLHNKYCLIPLLQNVSQSQSSPRWRRHIKDNELKPGTIKSSANLLRVDLEGKIVGGVPANIEQFPFAVKFYNMGGMCSGTILTTWLILTAAHCYDLNNNINDMFIHVGLPLGQAKRKKEILPTSRGIPGFDWHRTGEVGIIWVRRKEAANDDEDDEYKRKTGSRYLYDANADIYDVWSYYVHNGYNTSSFSNDIALMHLASQIKLGKAVQRAILADSGDWMNEGETQFQVAGWGWTSYGGEQSDLLMTNMSFVSLNTCMEDHQLQMSRDMFCLYGDGERDSCRGDSGGAVLWKGMVVGIVSHGDGCAKKSKPSVYTNVWYFRNWIEKAILRFQMKYCEYLTTKSSNINKITK